MSESKINPTNESGINSPAINGENATPDSLPNNHPAKSAKITLWGEIKKGWDWVVFSWQMLQRLGSFREIVRTILFTISLLIKRTLIQWGILKN